MKKNKYEKSGNAYIITLTDEPFDEAASEQARIDMEISNRSDDDETLNRLRAVARHNKGIRNG